MEIPENNLKRKNIYPEIHSEEPPTKWKYINSHPRSRNFLQEPINYDVSMHRVPLTNFTNEYADYSINKNYVEHNNVKKLKVPITNLTHFYENCTQEHTDSEYSDSEDEGAVHQNSDE